MEPQLIISKYEMVFFLEIAIKNFKEQLIYLKNPPGNMIGTPEWYCQYCHNQEINDKAGIPHLENHIQELEGILKNTKYTHYFDNRKENK